MSEESDKFLASVIVDALNGQWKVGLMEIGKLRIAFKTRNEHEVLKFVAKDLFDRSPDVAAHLLDELRSVFGQG